MEIEQNPYATPEAAATPAFAAPALADYTPAQIKKLYYRSCNVSAIAGLMLIGVFAIGALLVWGKPGGDLGSFDNPVLLVMMIMNLVGAIGIIQRSDWGRIAGIIACFLMLINVPLGTIIGIVGLFAFFKAKELFGPDRIRHRDLKLAFKELKRKPLR